MKQRVFAWIAMMSCVAPLAHANGPGADGLRLVQRLRDAAAGAEVRVYRGTGRELRVEVQDSRLLIRKHVTGTTMAVTMARGGEELGIAIGPEEIVVSDSTGRVRATRRSPGALSSAQQRVARSRLAADAAALLARVVVRDDSPVVQSLLSTRALLESATGSPRVAVADLRAWHGRLLQRATVRRVGTQSPSPTDCWNAYAREAIAAWREYEQCMADTSWWEIIDKTGCALVYDTRAIGAFLWYLDCVGVILDHQD